MPLLLNYVMSTQISCAGQYVFGMHDQLWDNLAKKFQALVVTSRWFQKALSIKSHVLIQI